MPSGIPSIRLDEHLARVLLLTLGITVVLTGGDVIGEVVAAAILATAILVLYTAVQAFRYGYVEGKLRATR